MAEPLHASDHAFLGMTQSLCPECLEVVPAKILRRDRRVYFRKRCPTHGVREDFVSGDAAWFDRHVGNNIGKTPHRRAVGPRRGCPYDCGLCTEHEQHTCLALLEITSSCNLTCPMCFASSAPGGRHLSLEECRRAIDALVAAEGRPEVLQLSGGEPTIHPALLPIIDYARDQPIDILMINTNGVRLAKDRQLLEELAARRDRLEIYLQMDGFRDEVYRRLRGEDLLETKLAAIEACGEAGLNMTLVATLQAGVNFGAGEVGELIDYASARPWVTGVSFQPATYSGRHFLPAELEMRVTLPDVIHAAERETAGRFRESDFTPLPCAHPNAHAIAYAYRSGGRVTPLARLIDLGEHIDLLSGRITYTRPRAKKLIEEYLSRQCCGPGGCGTSGCDPIDSPPATLGMNLPVLETTPNTDTDLATIGLEFVERAISERLDPCDVFRVTITSFMDAYNFDLRQLMQSCVAFALPTGHLIPFSAYNVLSMIDPVYTLIMAAAVLAGGVVLHRSQRSLPIDRTDRLAIGFAAFCGAMIGSKAPFVLAGDAAWWSAPAWLANGKTILAGLVGGYLAVELAKWALEIRTKTGDSFAPAVAVAVAIGRLGCFRAGCCYGVPTDAPCGVVFPLADQLPRHPTQLYEAAFHAVMAIVLITLQRRGLFRGQLLKLYIMTYAVYRM
ncbi:unnamed protein product, partial [Symbiodinium sp. CCMP2456]